MLAARALRAIDDAAAICDARGAAAAIMYVARAADNSEEAMTYLVSNNHMELARVAAQMRYVKNTIERNNNDVHKISRD